MATDGWRSGRPLNHQVRESSGSFDFFQLIQLLQLEIEETESLTRKKDASREATEFRFSADLGAGFPASDIRSVQPLSKRLGQQRNPNRLLAKTSNYCVASYSGPLPEAFSSWIISQKQLGNYAAADFLDIFNHRINLLRYEVGAASKNSLDRRHPTENLLAPAIASVMGMASSGLFEQLPLNKRSLLALAGLMANHRLGAHIVQRVLTALFRVPLQVRDLVGAWKDIASDQLCRLGTQASHLGELCILGSQTWDMHARIRTRVGPLPFSQLLDYLPAFEFKGELQASATFTAFEAMHRFLTNRAVDIEVSLEVDPASVPPPVLNSPVSLDQTWMRLGQSSWLGTPNGNDRYTCYLIYGIDTANEVEQIA